MKKKSEVKERMPELVADSAIDVQFGRKDLAELINLLTISSQTFEMLAQECLKESNDKAFNILSHRTKLSKNYADKLAVIYDMGETTSRELH